MTHIDDGLKQTIDLISVTTVFGTLMGILPSIAAIFSIIWSAIRIYETETFQKFLTQWKKDHL